MDKKNNERTRPWDYVDFELEIRKGARRKYPVSVRSPEGEAQGQMRFPFAKKELQDKLKDLETTVLLSGRRSRRIRTSEAQSAQDFGQALFQALLSGEVRTQYDLSLREAKQQNKGLRLKLDIQAPELTVLPWEFLYDPGRNVYLSLSSKTPLVRYIELREPIEQLTVTPPLRILGMVASPLDLDPLDVGQEKRRMEEAIKELQTRGRVELTWLEGQTPRDLQRALAVDGPWHVFHFIGHGGFDRVSDQGLIALTNQEGYAQFVQAEDLAQLLKDHWDLRLVVLNSCEGARGSESDAFSSTAATLVRPGIPAVLANQYEITDEAAIEFSRTFYQAVADGLPVDAAVAYARTSLKIEIDNTLEWATPVLYMRSPDGRIFDISSEALPVKPPQEETREESLRRYREGVKLVWADGELDRHEVEWLRDLANNKLELSPGTSAHIEREVMGDTFEAMLERQERVAEEEYRKARLEETETKGGSKQSTKPGGEAKTGPAATGGSLKWFLPRSKRAVLVATIVGILLVLLTGSVALGLTGIGPAASWLGGPESRPVGENLPDQPPNNQQDTAAREEDAQEPPSTKPPSTKPPSTELPDPAPADPAPVPAPAPAPALAPAPVTNPNPEPTL